MKKPVKSKPISQQEEKRSFAIKLIGKKIKKPDVMRIAKISERSFIDIRDLSKPKEIQKQLKDKVSQGLPEG